MTTAPSLINIPDLAVDIILKNVDFKAIFSLRKVCKSLRDYIDKRKPEVHMNHIEFSMTPDLSITAKLKCNPKNEEEIREITYSEDPLVSFQRDLKIIRSHWKNQWLDVFKVDLLCMNPDSTEINQKFIDCIRNIFWNSPDDKRLNVTMFVLQVANEQEIMQLLSFVDPNSLGILSFLRTGRLDLTEIRETDHFKRAPFLSIVSEWPDIEPIEAFIGRSIVNISSVLLVYRHQMWDVLMSFRDHDHVQEFTISFFGFPDLKTFMDDLGNGRKEGDNLTWLIGFENLENCVVKVEISVEGTPTLSFKRVQPIHYVDVIIEDDDDEESDEEDEDELV
ncbi:unnamed protein product [Caenorhabditis brenneri]